MIEKILERLEEERELAYADFDKYAKDYELDLEDTYDDFLHKGLERAKVIVQEVSKEYDWIPVEQKLPEDFTHVYATCISLIDDRKPWVTEGEYNSAIGWKGMAPMLELGKAKVIAWMPKEWPAPYRKGGE